MFWFLYFVIYWLFYKFSGAHYKPTDDSKYDPRIERQNSIWYRMIRRLENWMLANNTRLINSPVPNIIPLPEIDASKITPELFNFLTQNRTRPLVMRGFFNESQAVRKWSMEYFMNEPFRNTVLKTLRSMDGEMAYTDFNKKLGVGDLTLGSALEAMQSGDDSLYINNITKLFSEHPELVDDLDLDRIERMLGIPINEQTWLKLNIFMGLKNTRSSLHCAAGGNVFCLVEGGKKEWTFISPEYAPYLRTTPAKDFSFVISGYDMVAGDSVLDKIPRYRCVLEKGDALYNPAWWLHDVSNTDGFTIGVAIRDHTAYTQCFTNSSIFTWMSSYWWRLNPLFLGLVRNVIGVEKMREKSLKSDKHVVEAMTKS